jgi:glycerol-3-phosphate dehydrogenase
MPYVAEGVTTTRAVHEYATGRHLHLPIVAAVWHMLYGGASARDVVTELMRIPVGNELAALRYT